MTTWITSDIHYNHARILDFCPKTRNFASVEDMNQHIVQEWNNTVHPDDVIYILGDVAFGDVNVATAGWSQMMGKKILIKGNHDHGKLKNDRFKDCFDEIHDYYEIGYKKHKVVMFHYPILEWAYCHKGAVHFYGHLHGGTTGLEKYRARDVGWDATGNLLSNFDSMFENALTGEIKMHHGEE